MRNFLILILCLLALSSCSSNTNPPIEYIPYDEIPENYSLKDAKNDGLVVHEDYDITSGQAVWDEFIKKTEKGEPSSVRLMFYYTLEGQGITPEYEEYEEIKDDYPGFHIQDLSFDGNTYTLYWVEGEEENEYIREYKYLKKFKESSPAIVRYILVNDNEVTWEDIFKGMVSSQFGAWIDHHTVYFKET